MLRLFGPHQTGETAMDPASVRRPPDQLNGRQAPKPMDGAASAYAVVCLMCGRTFGHILGGRFFAQPGSGGLERDGHRLRCGHCRGSVLFEPDPAFSPGLDPAKLLAEFRGKVKPGRRAKRAAG
jgi:hypothetical protein